MARRRLTDAERELLDAIADRIAAYPPVDPSPEVIQEAARITVAALKTSSKANSLIGPACSTSEIAAWWGVSRQAIHKAISQHRVVAVQDNRRTWHFPTWQLREDRKPLAGISDCLEILDRVPRAMVAAWFIRDNSNLDGMKPSEWLIKEEPIAPLQLAAKKFLAAYLRNLRNRKA
ncbi:hypothetical protein BK816_03785 [Boudabousia tangfeifanii]|uniref:Helix-turn-helix domain-containing protein n=1 Tax=Boudabousia tangfeifanii TaxID=1912795 RepID=A0A1D9MJP0_9ACTO|nr:hypothetical protein [Boudabousia tangfeifanii]AOZ72525.1 hypothetical protein BK816_03785 [Boudabousia tangfeifanii]